MGVGVRVAVGEDVIVTVGVGVFAGMEVGETVAVGAFNCGCAGEITHAADKNTKSATASSGIK